jgi:hypothetical protein
MARDMPEPRVSIVPTVMIRPPSRSRRNPCWVTKNGARLLTANNRSKSPAPTRGISACSPRMPPGERFQYGLDRALNAVAALLPKRFRAGPVESRTTRVWPVATSGGAPTRPIGDSDDRVRKGIAAAVSG